MLISVSLVVTAFVVILFSSAPAEAIVLCTTPDGKTYAGDNPPADCKTKSEYERVEHQHGTGSGATASSREPRESAADAGASIIQKRQEEREAAAAMKAEIARKKRVPAVEFVETYDRVYDNGRFIEGEVANSADFPVYNVKVCINGNCRMVRPATLQPGAQGSFSFRASPKWRVSGNMDVTWGVVP